ncbi:hypothetical protein ACEPAH_5476 [Sanghuangporus vaninii]
MTTAFLTLISPPPGLHSAYPHTRARANPPSHRSHITITLPSNFPVKSNLRLAIPITFPKRHLSDNAVRAPAALIPPTRPPPAPHQGQAPENLQSGLSLISNLNPSTRADDHQYVVHQYLL